MVTSAHATKPTPQGDHSKSETGATPVLRHGFAPAPGKTSGKVIDIFDAAGLKKPDISILSDEFLAEVKHLPQRNLAVELLQIQSQRD